MSKPDAASESLAIPRDVRDEVDQRDGLRCRFCGNYLGERRAHHHIIYGGDARGMGGRRQHNAEEIITLCWLPGDPADGHKPCHEVAHSNKSLWQPLLLEVVKRPGTTALQLLRWRRVASRRQQQEKP